MLAAILIFLFTLVLVIWQPRGLGIGWSASLGAALALVFGVVHLADIAPQVSTAVQEQQNGTGDAVRVALTAIKGIGPWTADIYLLMVLRRPDAWPSADLALAVAVQQIKGLAARPGPQELEMLGWAWRPWRAVAARLLWHHYLSGAAPI